MPSTRIGSRTAVVAMVGLLLATNAALATGPEPIAEAAAAAGRTMRASVADAGDESPTGGERPALSADGRHVAFVSTSPLADLDNQAGVRNVFVRDLASGHTVQISRGRTDARQVPPDGDSADPSISADGRYVAFVTEATNIVDTVAAPKVVVVVDRDPDGDGDLDERSPSGLRHRTVLVTGPREGAGSPRGPRLSTDAGRIVWVERVEASWDTVWTAVLRKDGGPVQTPAGFTQLGKLRLPLIDVQQREPAVSGDGQHVLLWEQISVLKTGELISRLRVWHASTGRYRRVDIDLDGLFLGDDPRVTLTAPAISYDGSVVAFQASQPLASRHTNVYVVQMREDLLGRLLTSARLVSRDNAGRPINGASPGLSADGRYVSFVTDNVNAHEGVDRATGSESCLFSNPTLRAHATGRAPTARVLDNRRDARTPCQVVARDVVMDAERQRQRLPRLPGALVSVSLSRDCRANLASDEVCSADDNASAAGAPVSADGSRIAFGSYATDLVERDGNRTQDVFVRGFLPQLRAAAVNLGSTPVGTSTTGTATIEHDGFGPVLVDEVSVVGRNRADFTVGTQTCEGMTMHRGTQCYVEVQFTPAAEGARTAQLRVTSPDAPPLLVDLTGTGLPRPGQPPVDPPPGRPPPGGPPPVDPPPGGQPRPAVLAASPGAVDFGLRLPLANRPDKTVTVVNRGGSALAVSDANGIAKGTPTDTPDDFAIAANTCGQAVPPGGKCTMDIRFTPRGAGARRAVLILRSNAPAGPHLVELSGQAAEQRIEVNPAVLRPGRVATVTGSGFAADRRVSVTLAGFSEATTARTDTRGTFSADVLIFPKSRPGQRTVRAKVTGVNADIDADEELLVVYGTSAPPNFKHRR